MTWSQGNMEGPKGKQGETTVFAAIKSSHRETTRPQLQLGLAWKPSTLPTSLAAAPLLRSWRVHVALVDDPTKVPREKTLLALIASSPLISGPFLRCP